MSNVLALAAVVAFWVAPFGCSDEKVTIPPAADGGTDAKPAGDGGSLDGSSAPAGMNEPAPIDCFKGTPKTNDELLNACWPDDVVTFVKKPTLPGGYLVGQALPAPPPPP